LEFIFTFLLNTALKLYFKYGIEISNSFAALENLDTEVDVHKAWETIRENIKISAKESLGY
jgi:hypothetical protein